MIQPGEFCRVTNNKDNVLKIKYNGRIYDLDPHRPVVVPVEAAILWFGDPRSIDKVQLLRNEHGKVQNMLPSRPDEIKRLRFKFGADLTGDESTFLETQEDGTITTMHNLPDVLIQTLEGQEVKMVVNDPDGRHALGADQQPATNQSAELLEIVKRQERQIGLLMRQLQIEVDDEDTSPDYTIPDIQATEDELPTDDHDVSPPKFKVYNTETGIPGPDIKELV